MYHYYTCPELGVRKAAIRRLACNCTACDEMITKPWIHGISAAQQERFKDPDNCKFKPLFGNENRWHIVDLLEKKTTDKEEVAASNEETLHYVTKSINTTVEIGKIGPYSFDREDWKSPTTEVEYYIVEF